MAEATEGVVGASVKEVEVMNRRSAFRRSCHGSPDSIRTLVATKGDEVRLTPALVKDVDANVG